jgi:hypothetical protein
LTGAGSASPASWQPGSAPPATSPNPNDAGAATLLAAGGAAVISGIIAFAIGDKDRDECQIVGHGSVPGSAWKSCVKQDDFVAKQAGMSVLAAGVTSTLLGGVILGQSHESEPPAGSNEAMATSGLVLAGLGAATLVGGATSWLMIGASHADMAKVVGGAVAAPFSVISLAIGIPLWIDGAASPAAPRSLEEPPAEFVHRSEPMMGAGIVLLVVGVGGVGLTLGTSIASAKAAGSSAKGGDLYAPSAVYSACAAAALIATGAGLLHYGSAEVPADEASAEVERSAPLWLPNMSVGPGAAELRWRF